MRSVAETFQIGVIQSEDRESRYRRVKFERLWALRTRRARPRKRGTAERRFASEGFIEVVSHPEPRSACHASSWQIRLRSGWAKFGYGATMLRDLEHFAVGHNLCHDRAQFGLGFKDSNSPHGKQTSLTSLNRKGKSQVDRFFIQNAIY